MVAVSEDPQSGASPDVPVTQDAGLDAPASSDAGLDAPVTPDAGLDAPVTRDAGLDAPATQDAGLDAPASPHVGQDVRPARTTRLSDIVAGHLADQARRTAQGAKARRIASTDDQPGMADLTPLRALLSDLMEEGRNARLLERIARALRRAADIIDPPGQ